MFGEIISSSPAFWQSKLWESILLDASQARNAEFISYGGATILVEYRSIGMGFFGAFSLGADMRYYDAAFLEFAQKKIVEAGAIFWQIEEYHPSGVISEGLDTKTYGRHILEPWTRTIDLHLTEGDIQKTMHKKCWYNIGLAWRRGVTTEWVDPTAENIGTWMSLLSETTSRDRFSGNSQLYYTSFLRNLRDSNSGGLLFAYFEGKVIAAGIFVYYHSVAIYYYGASTSDPEMRRHMAPYVVQWTAILEGKHRGCHTYDFLGTAVPGDTESHLAGVSEFKEKFGGNIIHIGAKHLIVLSSFRYFLYGIARFVRNFIKK